MTEVAEAPDRAESKGVAPINHWIGGKLVAGSSGRTGPVYNPATGEQTGAVDFASVEEVAQAVAAARAAFPAWRSTSLSKRSDIFFRIRQLFHEHREDIARFLTLEHGKVTSDALGEVARPMPARGARERERAGAGHAADAPPPRVGSPVDVS